MDLIEMCTQKEQNLEQNGMQDVQVGAEAEGRQELQVEAPAEAEVSVDSEAEAQTPAESEQDAPADGLQNDRQYLPADAPADVPQGQSPEVAGVVASAEDNDMTSAGVQTVPAGSAARFLPPKREKLQMVNVTMRLTPGAKARAARLAHARGMSLSEFCAAVIDNVVREAGEEQAA